MIELLDLGKAFVLEGRTVVTAVQGVTETVERGEFVVVTGRSGSGKTTLLNLAAGLTRPTAGRVLLGGQDLWALPDAARSRLRGRLIGFVFQFPSLLPTLTTLENVLLPVGLAGDAGAGSAEARARGLLELVGLSDKLRAYPRQLSAGQQQRVVLARSLVNEPQIVMADEPSSNLDEQTEREMMELFGQVHAERRVTIVMVTHTSQLAGYGTRALEMKAGRLFPAGIAD